MFESKQANIPRVEQSPCPLQMAPGKSQKKMKMKKDEEENDI